ncbi:putative secreted protein (Por secretion system target) [Flavobacteriaceae bacterium MAR_2010_105]|nr:putative secreted protein (Por secretion system target) [Flavobacteriaceae bacterium MAR_2010_105]
MKSRLLILATIFLFNTHIAAQTIWNGPTTIFTKADNVDWTLEANQDRINSNVWITRANSKGIFNIAQETVYTGSGTSGNSPLDTEWAFGTTSNLGSLTFTTWAVAMDNSPSSKIGLDMVVHLISDDIYIDIKFLSWTSLAAGGGFSYQRSTDSGLSTNYFSINTFTISPNPNNSNIKLNLPAFATTISVKVYNVLGNEILSINGYQNPIDVFDWEKGIYLVQVSNLQQIQTKKFIKN